MDCSKIAMVSLKGIRETINRSNYRKRRGVIAKARLLSIESLEERSLLAATVLYRVNAGGPAIADSPAWIGDTSSSPSSFSNASAALSSTAATGVAIDTSHVSIPSGTPTALFATERWDPPTGAPLEWNFPVTPGDYEVRLYFAETYGGTQAVNARVFDVSIEGVLKLDNFDIFSEVGGYKAIAESFVVTADSNIDIDFAHVIENPNVNAIEIIQLDTTGSTSASAEFSIAPPSTLITSSTYESSTFVLTNTSTAGEQITSVKVDLGTAIFKDMVFDPNGTAGDVVAKGFTIDSNAGIGVTSHSLTGPHDDGFDAIQVNFTTFDPGKTFAFSIDVDPTSIRGTQAPGPGESGSVSGLELTGATVTVNYSGGATSSARTFAVPGSVSASKNIVRSSSPVSPTISLVGVASTPTTVTQAVQTARVGGPVGSSVVLLVTEGALFTQGLAGGGFDIDPFEANSLVAVREYVGTVGSNGLVDIPISLSKSSAEGGIHAIVAGFKETDGRVGNLSSVLTVKLGDTTPAAIGFGKSNLAGTSSTNPTSLQFGPDGRLYTAQQDGAIKVYTVGRTGANAYVVTSTETINLIKNMPNRNDNGVLNTSVTSRLVTGLLVTGTAANPVIYAVSSDPRIGAGPSGDDLDLDTNSGILSKLTWNGSQWVKVDLVRGLPRSEENHVTNGLVLNTSTNTLYAAQGGHTNMGGTSNNFAFLPEYALSAAILSFDLNAIGSTTYDIPTLDDETRVGVTDANDPFGGNNGKNQAKLVPGGPVTVYAPGFRNPYDLVFTQSGNLYTIDNGPNAGWGNVPINEGPAGLATNGVSEPGVTYGDGLHLITGAGYYGGHPNPTRSNPLNKFNTSNPQSPVTVANAIESDYRVPGPENGALVVFPASTNGLVEYTASNFGGVMKGDLLAGSFDNAIKRVKLNAGGNAVVLSNNLFSNVDIVPLDVTTQGDSGQLPGTIWVADHISGKIIVFEPNDYSGGPGGGNPNDLDGDGYSNSDETANGTDPNNAGDRPADWDSDFLSNLLDNDDDNDTQLDTADAFAIDATNGLSTPIGTSYSWENGATNATGLFRMGFTGLMTNGVSNYESLFDAANITAGGAAGVFTLDEVNSGSATGGTNTQQQAFQFGVNTNGASAIFSAHTRVLGPFAGITPQGQQSMGLFLGTGDQDNYVKIVISANSGAPAIKVLSELESVVTTGETSLISPTGPASIDLYLTVDPVANTVQPNYSVTASGSTGLRINVGAPISIPASWLASTTKGLAVGIISSTEGTAPNFAATWDFLSVPFENAPVLASIGNKALNVETTATVNVSATDADGSPIILTATNLPSFATFVSNIYGQGVLILSPSSSQAGTYSDIVIKATDGVHSTLFDTETISIVVSPTTNPVPNITSFGLINADTDLVIPGFASLASGQTINLTTLPTRNLSIQAITDDSVGSVRFSLNGNPNFRTENFAPYALYGDNSGVYFPGTFAVGSYSLTATAFSGFNATGTAGEPLTITFQVIDQVIGTNQPPVVNAGANQNISLPNLATLAGTASDDGLPTNTLTTSWETFSGPGTVTFGNASQTSTTAAFSEAGVYTLRLTASDGALSSFSDVTITVAPASSPLSITAFALINADSDLVIPGFESLTTGLTIDLASLPTRNLNIQAISGGTVGSVRFSLNGTTNFSIENAAPYALFGDSNGNFNAATLAVGNYALTATPYSSSGGTGTAGTPLTINFQVIDQPAALFAAAGFDDLSRKNRNPVAIQAKVGASTSVPRIVPVSSTQSDPLDDDLLEVLAVDSINYRKRLGAMQRHWRFKK